MNQAQTKTKGLLNMIKNFAPVICVSAVLFFMCEGMAQPAPATTQNQMANPATKRDTKRAIQLTNNAKIMLDSWRATPGDIVALEQAKNLLMQAQEADDQYAPSYLQTARYNLLTQYAYRDSTDKNYAAQAISVSEMATNHALELDPKLSDAYVFLADIHQVAGDLEKATDNLNKAEQLGCKSPWLEIQRAVVEAHAANSSDQAILKHLSSALKRAEQLRDTRAIEAAAYGIGNYYRDQHQDKLAAPYLKKADQARSQLTAQAQEIASKL